MAWTSPMTAVANDIFTAAQFNTNVRDNMLVSEGATVSAATQHLVSTAANTLAVRTSSSASVNTFETTTSTTYADLATSGPAVTATTGTQALVHVASHLENTTTANASVWAGFAVSGASTVAAADSAAAGSDGIPAADAVRYGVWKFVTGLTAGSNTFTMKYRASSGTGNFGNRHIIVVPL